MTDRPPTDDTGDDAVRDRLSLIGASIPTPDEDDTLIGVEQVATRRRRRGRAAAGLIGAGVLVAGGVVVANLGSSDDSGSLQSSADVAAPAPDDETEPGPADADGEATDDGGAPAGTAADPAVPATTAAPTPSGVMVDAARSTVAAAAEQAFADTQVLPWKDGFLSISTTWPQQQLPAEFSEEVQALFPDEVIALIEAERPATIDEATQLLSEAGLLDAVTQVLADHPEASQAVYSAPAPEPVRTVLFSVDGVSWEPIDHDLPDTAGMEFRLQSDGERLVGLRSVFGPQPVSSGPFGGPPALERVEVVVTDDLTTWREIPVPVPAAEVELPEFFIQSAWPSALALSDDGWAISFERYAEPDLGALLADRIDPSVFERGFGTSLDDVGVSIETFDDDGRLIESITFTWDELGVDGGAELAAGQGRPEMNVVSGTFDGVVTPPTTVEGYGSLVGFSDGFLRFGETTQFSADGVTWTDATSIAEGYFGGGVLIDDGDSVILFSQTEPGGPALASEFDSEALLWRPASGPELPAGSHDALGNGAVSGAAVYSVSPPWIPEPFENTASTEVGGYTLSITVTELGQSYTLVDAGGTEIVGESFEHASQTPWSSDGPFEHLVMSSSGTEILDPATGEVLVELTEREMSDLYQEAYSVMDQFGPEEPIMPEHRLVATDGERWIDVPLFDESETASVPATTVVLDPDAAPPSVSSTSFTQERWPQSVASNGGVVLVALSDGSIERFEF